MALTFLSIAALVGGVYGVAAGAWWLVHLNGVMAAGHLGALLLLRVFWQLRKRVVARHAARAQLWRAQQLDLTAMRRAIRAEHVRLGLRVTEWAAVLSTVVAVAFAVYCLLVVRNGAAAGAAFGAATAAFEGHRMLEKQRPVPQV
ncbi:hypothetical protein [Streptomyces tailanensis]|uniref:hypothetical protein n=1 Tax=Streptomyces tailanensis TaxID=2569858 RepID=UPI00122E1CBC|nr:hypothetical protein [Streptomyces tailanensis]